MQPSKVILLYLFFGITCYHASEIGPELKAYKNFHNTYFITRTNRNKDKEVRSLHGFKKQSFWYSSCQKKDQDNATLDFKELIDCKEDVIYQVKLDGKIYDHEEALGDDCIIIINVTMEYFKNFLKQNHPPFHYHNIDSLSDLLNKQEEVIKKLSKKQQDQIIEAFLYCCDIQAASYEPVDKHITVFKKELDKIINVNSLSKNVIEKLKNMLFNNSKFITLTATTLFLGILVYVYKKLKRRT